MTKDKDTTQNILPMAMKKTVTVYVVKTSDQSVNFPTKARATGVIQALALFGINSEMETVKKEIDI